MVSRNYTYSVDEIIKFVEKYFEVNHYKRRGDGLITSEFSITNTDIDMVLQYFDKDMKVFDICLSTFAGGWEHKRKWMKIQMDVCEKENKYDYWLQTPEIPYCDMYSLKKVGALPEITKEEIFDKIHQFFKLTCKKEQLRDINLIELGIN
jgi:hypothetical protein